MTQGAGSLTERVSGVGSLWARRGAAPTEPVRW